MKRAPVRGEPDALRQIPGGRETSESDRGVFGSWLSASSSSPSQAQMLSVQRNGARTSVASNVRAFYAAITCPRAALHASFPLINLKPAQARFWTLQGDGTTPLRAALAGFGERATAAPGGCGARATAPTAPFLRQRRILWLSKIAIKEGNGADCLPLPNFSRPLTNRISCALP